MARRVAAIAWAEIEVEHCQNLMLAGHRKGQKNQLLVYLCI
jgi:hypothetical protein